MNPSSIYCCFYTGDQNWISPNVSRGSSFISYSRNFQKAAAGAVCSTSADPFPIYYIKVIFEKKKNFFYFKRGILRALISHMSCFEKRRRNVTRTWIRGTFGVETGHKGRDYISCTLSHVFFSWLTEVVLATTSVTRHFSFVVLNDPWKRKKVNEKRLDVV